MPSWRGAQLKHRDKFWYFFCGRLLNKCWTMVSYFLNKIWKLEGLVLGMKQVFVKWVQSGGTELFPWFRAVVLHEGLRTLSHRPPCRRVIAVLFRSEIFQAGRLKVFGQMDGIIMKGTEINVNYNPAWTFLKHFQTVINSLSLRVKWQIWFNVIKYVSSFM
jgi:hypothetical protein